MTQRWKEVDLRKWMDDPRSALRSIDMESVVSDLLSLRAAVRRVLEADAAVVAASERRIIRGRDPVRIAAREEFYASMAALRAEMGGIDKEGGA